MERRVSFLISIIFHLLIILLALTVKFPEKPRSNLIHRKLKGLYAYIPPKATMPPMPYVSPSPPATKKSPPAPARKKQAFPEKPGEKIKKKEEKKEENNKSNGKEKILTGEGNNSNPSGKSPGGLPLPPANSLSSQGVASGKGDKFWNALSHLSKYIPKGAYFSSGSTAGKVVGGSAVFETGDYDITPWAEKIIPRVKGNWIVPLAAKLGFKGVSVIFVVIEKDGRVSVLYVERSSGIKAFDQAALNAIRSSAPFPPLPPDFPLPNLRAHFLFFYNVSPVR